MAKQTIDKTVSIYTSIPAWLYDAVAADAKKNSRSIAAQIGLILKRRYAKLLGDC